MSTQKIVTNSIRMDQLKRKIDELGAEKSRLQKEYDAIRYKDLPSLMEQAEIESIRVRNVGTVYIEGGVDVSIPADKREEAYQYVEEVLEAGEIIKPFIQSSTLKANGKLWVMEGRELPEELFKVRPYQLAKILRR